MTQPTDWNNGTVIGTFLNNDFTPFVGSVVITPAVKTLRVYAQANVLLTATTVELDETGSFSVTLPASVDPEISPNDWTYTAAVVGSGSVKSGFGSFTFKLEVGATVDLDTATIVAPSTGIPNIIGGGGGGTSSWADITGKPAVIAAGADAATARAVIGAGTGNSNLVIGTTAGTAKDATVQPAWTDVTSKPLTFAPSAHTHAAADISGSTTFGQGFLSLASEASARTKIGMTSVGSALAAATDATAGRNAIAAMSASAPVVQVASGSTFKVWQQTTDPGASAAEGDWWIKT